MRRRKAIDTTAGDRAFETIRQQFSAWRGSRSHRGRIPEELWRSAMEQAAVHGVGRTARALRLNATELKKRIGERMQISQVTTTPAPMFVELTPMPMPRSICTVEFIRGDGTRMRVELPGTPGDELRAMTETFLGGAR